MSSHRSRAPLSSRWLILGAAATAGVVALASAVGVSADPQQNPTCTWDRLPSGERRSQHSLTYLPESNAVASFAGADLRASQNRVSDDLWLLGLGQGGAWREFDLNQNPGDRMEHTSVLRQIPGGGQEMVVYGGVDSIPGGGGTGTWTSPLLGTGQAVGLLGAHVPAETINSAYKLTFNGSGDPAAWSSIGTGAQRRTDHSAIFVPGEDVMLVFGGRSDEDAGSAENSLWQLPLGESSPAWQRVDLTGGPSRRFAHSAVWVDSSSKMVVYGGTTDWNRASAEVWQLSLLNGVPSATWSELPTIGAAPPARYDHAAVYSPQLDWMIVLGGTTNGQSELADVWALDMSKDPAPWIRLRPDGNGPPGLVGLAGAYSWEEQKAIFYGGQVGPEARDQTWALSCSSGTVPTDTPPTPTETQAVGDTPTATATESETPVPGDTVTATATETGEATEDATGTATSTPVCAGCGSVYLPWSSSGE